MKKLILLSLILLGFLQVDAQINALTENGDQVILFDNGTWKYVEKTQDEDDKPIPENKKKFKKSSTASFLVKSNIVNVGVWIDPKKWTFSKGTDKDDYEFEFERRGEDLYGMLIAEKVQIPLSTLVDIALENARSVSPDIHIVKKEYRNVNGVKVLMMQMAGTIQGVKFTYYGYYYSNSHGTIQLLMFTGSSLFDIYKDEIEEFLNGFVEL